MKEVTGNLWDYDADYRVITTNGTVKSNGCAVMGRGCAAEAKERYPGLDKRLGTHLKMFGNKIHLLHDKNIEAGLWSFPVKHNWWERADIKLIKQSAEELASEARACGPDVIFVMPRPGCGNGRLQWETVRAAIADILPDNVHVITFK